MNEVKKLKAELAATILSGMYSDINTIESVRSSCGKNEDVVDVVLELAEIILERTGIKK